VPPEAVASSALPVERGARPAEARARPHHRAWTGGGAPVTPDSHAEAHVHGGPVPGLTTRIPAPMRVAWTVVESSAGRVRLVAEVERRLGFGAPVAVHLSLPRGAALLEGPADFTVPEGRGGDVRSVSYVVTFGTGAPPTEDLVLVAHAEGASFGAHAEQRYSFGREPSAAPRPVPVGPVLPVTLMMGTEPGMPGDGSGEPTP
jgi:hypothetical protein